MSVRSSTQLRLREHQLFLALTIVVGVLAGLSAVLFTVAIDWATRLFFGLDPSAVRLFFVPVLVSLVTGALLAWVFPDVRGSGVPQTEAAYHLRGGVIPARVPLGKFVTGVLCIGSGHSMGREGPSVQIGAGLASAIGRWVPLSPARVKDLVPVGAAGALAAAFNTPVAAVLFSLEEIIGDMNAALLGSTVVASVASVVVERSILGNEPLFRVPAYHLQHPAELFAYAVLGIVGGVVSLVFCQGLLGARSSLPEAAGVDTYVAARAGRPGDRRAPDRHASSHGCRLRIRGPGSQWRTRLQDHGAAVRREAGRHHRVLFVRQCRRHLRPEPLHRRDGRRRRGHAGSSNRPAADGRSRVPMPWWAWEPSSPGSSARR